MLGYLWLHDLAIAGISALCLQMVVAAFPWRSDGVRRNHVVAVTTRLVAVALLVANPWVYWTASFDIHMEVFGAFFAFAALRALLQHRRSSIIWGALTLLCGAASALSLVGVGLAA